MTDRACPCAEQVVLHLGHCCLREWDGMDGPLPCGHDDDFNTRARAARFTETKVQP